MKILHSFNNEKWNVNPLTSSQKSSSTASQDEMASSVLPVQPNSRFGCLVYFWFVPLCMTPRDEEINPQAGSVPQKQNLDPDSLSSGQVLQPHCLTEMLRFALWVLDPQCLTTVCPSPICEIHDPLDKDRDKMSMEQQAMCTEQSQ